MTWMFHPQLYAGLNSSTFNGDEGNGPGYNEPVWPTLIDTFVPYVPLIMEPSMLAVFEGCADITFPAQGNEVTFAREVREVLIRKAS